MLMLWPIALSAQIKIGGNVYGGGNHAEVRGSTKVTVKAGDIGAVMDPEAERPLKDPQGRVFGGARMANVGGSSFVHIDGESELVEGDLATKSNYILVNQVFGGNDIAGQVGTAEAVGEEIPTELTAVKKTEADQNDPKKNAVDKTFNSYVRVSTKLSGKYYTQDDIDKAGLDPEADAYGKTTNDMKPAEGARKVYIGQLFAGGNGDFTYTDEDGNALKDGDDYVVKQDGVIIGRSKTPFQSPEQDKTYLEVVGGSIVYAYGGGNNATVNEKTIIHVDNPSAVVNHIKVDASGAVDEDGTDLLSTERFLEMGINTTFSMPSSGAYQVGRFFGGNNVAEMHIRPTWNLLAGKIRNLYSGGNKGIMTSPEGLLIELKDYSTLIVDNLYGGCRMADVMPTVNGIYTPCTNLQDKDKDGNLIYKFPNELSARVLVRGGYVHNVYGGNDVTGTVYGGNAVGIYTTVHGDVYGGGNGAYPYTDSEELAGNRIYGDYNYFDKTEDGVPSYETLNKFRPNAEQVSLRLKGTDADHPTIIKGSVFVGGNCASLATKKNNPMVELKIGSYVKADKVFLGNNGEKMVDKTILQHYAGKYPGAESFSSLNLKGQSAFAGYMDGVAMSLHPTIVFDNIFNGDPDAYEPYSSYIGSFYCGGNKGSMITSGKTSLKFDQGLVIFEKLVGGCNDADVPVQYDDDGEQLTAAYEGGFLGSSDERLSYTDESGKIKDRIEIDLSNVVVEPKRWNDEFEPITAADIEDGKLKAGTEYYETDLSFTKFIADGTEEVDLTAADKYYKLKKRGDKLEWNTAIWSVDEDDFVATGTNNSADDEDRRLMEGNIYGGCYTSGHVNGNVVINITQDLVKRDIVFAETDGEDEYTISGERRSGVLLEAQGDDVQAVSMTVFGGGCGQDTEIWGSTTINHTNGYAFQLFGGGEEGVVGKKNDAGEYAYNAAYSTTVNLKGANAGYSKEETGLPLAETEYIYGGGSEGDVLGDSYVYLGNGRIYDAFGGASNANIYGGTEVYIGYNGGFPWVRDNVYGGNDFGGTIMGKRNHTTTTSRTVFDADMLQSATYVKYIQGRVDSIYGGSYGNYDYADPVFKYYTYSTDEAGIPDGLGPGAPRLDKNGEPVFSFPHLEENSFVHFVPDDNSNNKVGYIFGGSSGYPGHYKLNDAMQKEAYVLLDDTKTKDENRFANTDVYGGGSFAGTGYSELYGAGRTAVDLFAGSFHNVYGGCNQEGLVGYTRVNVPSASTAKVNSIFGGGKGYSPALFDEKPALAARYCDHYVTCVDYQGSNAIVNDAIYGGNENCRIACDTYLNITVPVMQSSGYQATVYGAGYGKKTVSGRTNVFMNNGSNAYKVFGGGRDGNAFNYVSLTQWLVRQLTQAGITTETELNKELSTYNHLLLNFGGYIASNPISLPDKTGTYVNNESGEYDGTYTNDIMPTEEKPKPTYHQTNVHIMNGGNVSGYAYGGGLGTDAVVAGTTYVELKGGNVDRDIYGGGQGGPVFDEFGLGTNVFTAKTNVYIESGMARNVYGGGYLGHVGKHCKTVDNKIVEAAINETDVIDIPAVANVTIGKLDGSSFYNGVPAILRNVYGGGEGGSLYGRANLTINNGYIGYRYKNTATSGSSKYDYVEELDDQKTNDIEKAGNVFGGGYVVNSYVDSAYVTMYGGTIRGSLYGGGEVGPIGRGTMKDNAAGGIENGKAHIYKAGKTQVKMFDGHVMRNVFGGGRGHDSWGGDGTMYMRQNMTEEAFANLDLKCKGYVFGQTEVNVYGGEVGTDEGVAQGYGNVFGGGDIGCVYSAYENEDGDLCFGKKNGMRYDGLDNQEGYYYKNEGGAFITDDNNEYILTEDCKVLVEPWCKATSNVSINGKSYAAGEYVPTSALNYLGNKNDDKDKATWDALGKDDVNKEGVIIHNAVFAGGNTSPGSTEVYANATTVFGNATASIHDVYNRDLISIGRGRVGGLYGDGNLTLVDGYRELNITNYGTDYYHINPEITLAQYNALPVREAAYYEIRYKCLTQCTDNTGKTYAEGSTITADELQTVFDGVKVDGQDMIQPDGKPLSSYWQENGVCSRYAGRPMNTVQRSDFCGVFGSRMVMQGAQDRVPETVDYTNYTINRVREVSLNKKESVNESDLAIPEGHIDYYKKHTHGNYFGIYSVVNYLGALTSDVDFHNAVRVTDNTDATNYKCDAGEGGPAYGTATYNQWKGAFHEERRRNNGNSHNKVALASGVYLELTTEKSTGTDLTKKDWGLITGVVELDLINVQPGMGGGYVYAKNEHGTRQDTYKDQTILTALNTGAATNKKFSYVNTSVSTQKEWETSGNFVHSTQTIIDDCYNVGGKYKVGESPVPAHYWFIKGAIYVYDQYISAYTGSSNAFSETVSIPLTITSASHGKMTLLNVQPSRYAYYSSKNEPLGEDQKIDIRDNSYGRNDVISYWDYSQLTATEKNLFVPETYVVIADCTYGEGTSAKTYKAGTVLLPSEYEALKASAPTKKLDDEDVTETPYVHHVSRNEDVAFDYVFRLSNNVSHDNGYILTYNIDNPDRWNKWYTQSEDAVVDNKYVLVKNQTGGTGFEDAPTYTPNTTGLYGQNDYSIGNIISKDDYDTYQAVKTSYPSVIPANQATFNDAYIVTVDVLETKNKNDIDQVLHKGATLAKENYTDAQWASMNGKVAKANVVTKTIQLSKTEFIYRNTYMTDKEKQDLKDKYSSLAGEIDKSVVSAYYCTVAGKYGGNYYQEGHNYRALAAFTAMSKEDRDKFTFNYDALDLLIDPTYSRAEGVKYQYDGEGFTTAEEAATNEATYSLATPIDYRATYKGSESLTYTADDNSQKTAINGTELTRTEYERLPNEQYYWAPIDVTDASKTYYVVKETIILGDTPYAAGQVITEDTYSSLSDNDRKKVAKLNFTSTGTYYYCREEYTISTSDDGHAVTSATGVTGATGGNYSKGQKVLAGVVIDNSNNGGYSILTNKQKNFSIHGLAPTETSTLYVTRASDIFDLSAEKIITVIYQYDYVESDMLGQHITPVSERHILNIHLNFESGVPTVEDIQAPDIILPGTTISIAEPYVTPGAYEITGGGWKLFDTESDAESHINGIEYNPVNDPLYLYQNKHYMAYYAKTYMGETFSNHVPVRVANYHDLKKVMGDKDHHYYIDHKEIQERLNVEPKVYINDYNTGDPETSKNGLDLFKNLYDLSLLNNSSTGVTDGKVTAEGPLKDHALLNDRIKGGNKLEFFLRTDINHTGDWTSIAPISDSGCFSGTLHGDGHTISGLNNSLFGRLCGDIYNLGVTGSFTGAGVAEEGGGYVESCWINTTGEPNGSVKAVFGNPQAEDGYKQIVNSYYQTGKNYNTTDNDEHGLATAMSDKEFYNGTVAYNLNNFYLHKRYANSKGTVDETLKDARYYTIGADNKLTLQPYRVYANRPDLCSSGYVDSHSKTLRYVEERYADGDFRYAAGEIPTEDDERQWIDTENDNQTYFYPIWPDDYIFFGQKLNYGWAVNAHQKVPTAVVKNSGRLSDGDDANRVYRAPAYYGTKTMGMAHFNPSAYLAQKSHDGTKEIYPKMTAIDFKGHNDLDYQLGMNSGKFYAPLLDDDGLTGIVNCDETRNLLVYAPSADDNSKTHGVLTNYFEDPAYKDYHDATSSQFTDGKKYDRVADATSVSASVYGHLIESNLKAITDHLLVDKEDFNCPIAYHFDGSHRMWYQRTPTDNEYVDIRTGWQGISVPFTAEMVTTSQKGEITHFFDGSTTGHEYWLRGLESGSTMTPKEADVLSASFTYPTGSSANKTTGNTFLWDYYYENSAVHKQKDYNNDTYLEHIRYDEYGKYYRKDREYPSYPRLTAATPYILGLPGATYYEFDLSGKFEALNTAVSIPKLDKQVITLASNLGVGIDVSDDEMERTAWTATYENVKYTFKPSYKNEVLAEGNYVMNSDGSAYARLSNEANNATNKVTPQLSAFRPYFATSASSGSRSFFAKKIVFDSTGGFGEGPETVLDGSLEIYTRGYKIFTTSHMKEATTIRIVNAAGATIKDYVLQPGETIETPVAVSGVYVVNKKKVFVEE